MRAHLIATIVIFLTALVLTYFVWSRMRRKRIDLLLPPDYDLPSLFRSLAALTWGHVTEGNRVTVVQNSLPRPPVLYIPVWSTSIQWRALLSAALVADMSFKRPQVYVTLEQAQSEAADPTPTNKHGWQEAVESIYPLKINQLKIQDGALFYWDKANPTPIHLKSYSLRAENIRNVRRD